MKEKFIINPKNGMGFRVGQGERPVERFRFAPQMETFSNFIAGKGWPENKRLTMTVNNRQEVWHRHESGFMDGEFRIMKIGAHPDDTGLDSGAAYLAVKKGKVGGVKKTRFGVITATAGQRGEKRFEPNTPIGETRINEDAEGTRLLGADFLANLGFMDGDVSKDEKELVERLTHYLSALRPHAIILADPEDPAHEDHKAVTRATIQALINTNQNPIVVYNEYQNGNRELTADHVAYRLTHEEYKAVQDAFFVHVSQTAQMTTDIEDLMDRPYKNADLLGFDIPIGVFRQDPKFSQEPFGKYLGDRVIPLPQAESELQLLRERITKIASERIRKDPTVIFDAATANGSQDSLKYGLALTNPHLVAPRVLETIKSLDQPHNVSVTKINPARAEDPVFFADNDIPLHAVAKSLVIKVNGSQQYAAVIVPANTRADLNGSVSEQLGVRQVSLAPQIIAKEATGMEPGSISPFGLPNDWPVLVDEQVVRQMQIMVGSGRRESKLVVPGTSILSLPNVRVLEGLGV